MQQVEEEEQQLQQSSPQPRPKRARLSPAGADGAASVGGAPLAAPPGRSPGPPLMLRPPTSPTLLTRAGWYDLGHGAVLGYFPAALDRLARLMPQLMALPWEQREIVVMGRRVLQPRRVCYYADAPHLAYTYSGLRLEPLPWGGGAVAAVRQALQEHLAAHQPPAAGAARGGASGRGGSAGGGGGSVGATPEPFNSCLLNLYEDGGRYVGWHRDDEPVFGEDPEIASVSFGAAREFQLREVLRRGGSSSGTGAGRRVSVLLSCGDVLVMRGTLQKHYQHSIPKRARVNEPRVSLTFRRVVAPEGGARR